MDPSELADLMEAARRASPNERVHLYRDRLARLGPPAIAAMVQWLGDPSLGRFAVRVLVKSAAMGFEDSARAALSANRLSAIPDVQTEINAFLRPTPGPAGSALVTRQSGSSHRARIRSDDPAFKGYMDWQLKLEAHFLRASGSNSPWTLFVDDALVSSLKGESDDLASSVRGAMTAGGNDISFEPLDSLVEEWTKAPQATPPPVFPILAASVVAATRMATDGVIAPHNYYQRFRELLGIPGMGSHPGYATSIPRYWELLGEWLTTASESRYGSPTFSRHPRFTRIGYAMSQALLRRADRQRFPQFFRWRGLRPGQKVQADAIIRWFETWAARHGISGGIKTMLCDREYRLQLANSLAADLALWDGHERDVEGRVQIQAILAVESARDLPTLWAVGQRRSTPVIVREGNAAYRVEGGPEGFVGVVGRALTPTDVFGQGVRLTGDHEFISLRPAPLVVFAHDDTLGMWAMRSTLPLAERLMIVAAPSSAVVVEEFLQSAARPGWLVQRHAFGEASSGFTYLSVSFDDLPSSVEAPEIASLLPPPQAGVALSGGLPILGERGIYLEGGEPDVVLDPSAAGVETVTVDGVPIPLALGTRVRLEGRGLGVGHHEVEAGGAKLGFDVVAAWSDGAHTQPSVEEVRWKVAAASGDSFEIDGAYLSPSAPSVAPEFIAVVPQAARFGWLLGRSPGEILDISRPLDIPWLAAYGMYGGPLDMVAPFPVAFAAYRTQLDGWVLAGVHSLSFKRQAGGTVSAQQVDEWRDAVLRLGGISPAGNVDLWTELLEVAKAMRRV